MNYFDILRQIRELLRSIDEHLIEAIKLLKEIKRNTDPYTDE